MSLTADQLRGQVRILVDGEEKILRFDQGALARLIDALGLQGLSELPSAISSLDADVLRQMVWAGLLWNKPSLEIEEVGSWFFPLLPTYQAAVEGLNLGLWGTPEPETGDGGSDDNADPPIGESGTSRRLDA